MTFVVCFLGALIILGAAGIHVAVIMFVIAGATALLTLGPAVVMNIGNLAWATQNDFILVSVPLFILLGELLLRAGLSERMYAALATWTNKVPGGLLHTNIVSCGLFAATSGSSIATAATIGTVALPAFREREYDERIVLGSLAAGGTLGILIPPSINMIVYGAMTDTSIGRLFAAGVIPGLILVSLFMLTIVGLALWRPAIAGKGEKSVGWATRLAMLVDLVPLIVVGFIVMGSIYAGWATATEAAGLGVVAALVIVGFYGRLSIRMLNDAVRSTIRTTGVVLLIVVAAFFLNFVISLLGVPQAIASWIRDMGISPLETILVLVLLYLVLGCFLETLSMMVTTIPVVTPLVVSLGFDPVWFGIFLVVMAELSLITPPVGMNLYVVHGIRGPGRDITEVMVGAVPFVVTMLLLTGMLIAWPQLALWLPDRLYQ